MVSAGRNTGPLLMVAASAAFTGMIALVKWSREWDYGTAELMGWRVLAAIPILYLLTGLHWRVVRPGLLLVRCVFGFSAMFCFYSATAGLRIGELSVLTKLQPVFVACIAPVVLGSAERPDRNVVIALMLGILGTFALVWPVLGEAPVRFASVLFGLAAAVFSASAHTTLRALGTTEKPEAIVFWFNLAVGAGVIAAIGLGPETAQMPSVAHLPVLGGIGLCAVLGQLWMTRAYRAERAARVAAASYVSPLMGFGVDAAFFGVLPTAWTALGAVLVVSAGGVLFRRQTVGARANG